MNIGDTIIAFYGSNGNPRRLWSFDYDRSDQGDAIIFNIISILYNICRTKLMTKNHNLLLYTEVQIGITVYYDSYITYPGYEKITLENIYDLINYVKCQKSGD